jgi:uncharacterized protein with LGFP repeats
VSSRWSRARNPETVRGDEKNVPTGRGRISEFEGGAIVWTPERGAEVRYRID